MVSINVFNYHVKLEKENKSNKKKNKTGPVQSQSGSILALRIPESHMGARATG